MQGDIKLAQNTIYAAVVRKLYPIYNLELDLELKLN
jgi:hypothetical protein